MSVLSPSSSAQLVPSRLNSSGGHLCIRPAPQARRWRLWARLLGLNISVASNGLSCRGGRGGVVFLRRLVAFYFFLWTTFSLL